MEETSEEPLKNSDTLSNEKICEGVLSVPACASYQQPLNCLEFWMRHNIPPFFDSLCTNETITENCTHSFHARNAVVALIHHCQIEVWTLDHNTANVLPVDIADVCIQQ